MHLDKPDDTCLDTQENGIVEPIRAGVEAGVRLGLGKQVTRTHTWEQGRRQLKHIQISLVVKLSWWLTVACVPDGVCRRRTTRTRRRRLQTASGWR